MPCVLFPWRVDFALKTRFIGSWGGKSADTGNCSVDAACAVCAIVRLNIIVEFLRTPDEDAANELIEVSQPRSWLLSFCH